MTNRTGPLRFSGIRQIKFQTPKGNPIDPKTMTGVDIRTNLRKPDDIHPDMATDVFDATDAKGRQQWYVVEDEGSPEGLRTFYSRLYNFLVGQSRNAILGQVLGRLDEEIGADQVEVTRDDQVFFNTLTSDMDQDQASLRDARKDLKLSLDALGFREGLSPRALRQLRVNLQQQMAEIYNKLPVKPPNRIVTVDAFGNMQ